MINKLSSITLLIFSLFVSGYSQKMPDIYFEHVKAADSLYGIKQYRAAADLFSEAFKSNGWKGLQNDRLTAAN